jgi:hypothetical protein
MFNAFYNINTKINSRVLLLRQIYLARATRRSHWVLTSWSSHSTLTRSRENTASIPPRIRIPRVWSNHTHTQQSQLWATAGIRWRPKWSREHSLNKQWVTVRTSNFTAEDPALYSQSAFMFRIRMTSSVVMWSEFLATVSEVPGSIPGATRFSDK